MKNKKKVLAVALAVCLIAVMSYSTLAWFTDEDKATNTFEIGSVDIDLVEDFVSPTNMLPVINTADPTQDANFVNKDVRVKNLGENAAYVQVLIAVPKMLDDVGAFRYVEVNAQDWEKTGLLGTSTIGGYVYNVYRYRYNKALDSNLETTDVITGAYLDSKVDVKSNGVNTLFYYPNASGVLESTGYKAADPINVYVLAQAVQSLGFADYTTALQETFEDTIPNFT